MKLNLVYFSPTGGTKSVAGFVAAAWDMEKTEIDLSALENTYPKHDFHKMYIGKILKVLVRKN